MAATAQRPAVGSLPTPPARMPLVRAGRQRKRWRWVGLFAPDVMACAAVARVGMVWQGWWAVWDREGRRLDEPYVPLRHRPR